MTRSGVLRYIGPLVSLLVILGGCGGSRGNGEGAGSGGQVTYELAATWGSEGSGVGEFHGLAGIAVDANGNVYVADFLNPRIQKFTRDGVCVTSWGLDGFPIGLAVGSRGSVYAGVGDGSFRVQRFTSEGQQVCDWGLADDVWGGCIGAGPNEALYVVEGHSRHGPHWFIHKYTSNGESFTRWGGAEGAENGHFDNPRGLATDSVGNVYVADYWNHRVQKFTSDGQFITKWGSAGSSDGQFDRPADVAVDSNGNVYVADYGNNRVQKFTSAGQFLTNWTSSGAKYLAVDGNGNVYVADYENNRIQEFRPVAR